MSSCDCDRKSSNGGNCDSSCKECEVPFTFETSVSAAKILHAPLVMTTKAAAVPTLNMFDNSGQ